MGFDLALLSVNVLALRGRVQHNGSLFSAAFMRSRNCRLWTLDSGPWRFATLYVCMLVFALSGCTPRQPLRPAVPSTTSETSEGSGVPAAEQLLAPLQARQQQLWSLRGLARVTYKDSEEKGTARQAVAVVAPDHVRVELFSPVGIAALVTTDGQRLAAYFPKEKTIYRGTASAGNAARFLRIMLSSSDIASLLLGLPFSIPQKENSVVHFGADRGQYVLSVPLEGGGSQMLTFDARNRHLLKWEEQDQQATVIAHMTLADYRMVQGQEFPFEIFLTDLQGGQEAGIYYEHVELNPPLANTLFTLAPIPSVQEIDLDVDTP